MSVNIKSISHKKSSVIENGAPKLPTAAQLELGELAINFADGYETLSIKNSNNEIVTFTNDLYWKDKEEVIANALTDLNSRILAITVPTNVSDLVNDVPYLAASDLDTIPTEDSTNGVTSGGVYDYITEIEEAISAELHDLNGRIDDIPTQVQADWNQTTTTAADYIKNKPTIPTTSTTVTEDDPNPVSGGAVYDVIVENEQITASALADLDERISNISKPDWDAESGTSAEILNKPPVPYYGTSSTTAGTIQKSVSISAIKTLQVGLIIIVKPSATSTVANSTIKLNDFNAYPMRYNNAAITTTTDSIVWTANVPSIFMFDGTYWQFIGHGVDFNTTYSNMSQSEASTGTATSARSISAKVLHDTIELAIPENIVTGASTAYTIWCGTQAEYNALQTYDNNTVYLIKENA